MGKNFQQFVFWGLFSFTCVTMSYAQLPFGHISASKSELVITINFGYPFETDTELTVFRGTTPDQKQAVYITTIRSGTFVDRNNLKCNLKYYYWFKSKDKHGEKGMYGGNDYGQIVEVAQQINSNLSKDVFGGNTNTPSTQPTTTRVALVIGNKDYAHITAAPTAIQDARFLAEHLRQNGWTVMGYENLENTESFKNEIHKFLKNVKTTDTILIYFAGHGIQFNNNNYLVPVKANIQKSSDIPKQAFLLDSLQTALTQVNCKTQIVLLDACKSNILGGNPSLDGVISGLNIIENQYVTQNDPAKKGLIAYATSYNPIKGTHSAFMDALKTALKTTKCLNLNLLLEKSRTIFIEKTGRSEVPWEIKTSLSDEVYLQRCD